MIKKIFGKKLKLDRFISSTGSTLTDDIKSYCTKKGPEYYEYDSFELKGGLVDDYELSRRIGKGKFSEVFLARNILNSEKVVIKMLKKGIQIISLC